MKKKNLDSIEINEAEGSEIRSYFAHKWISMGLTHEKILNGQDIKVANNIFVKKLVRTRTRNAKYTSHR